MKNFKFKWLLLSIILSIASINTMWAWNLTKGRTIYFDKQNCTDFGNPWFRLGNNDASMAGTMTLVAGTKYLYSYTAGSNWDNYGAFSVADDDGWTGSNSIYQNTHGITKQTDYQKYDLSSNCYLKITSSANKADDCQYYHVNNITSGDGTLTSLPTYSISYNSPTNGTLTVQKYNGSTYSALSSGTTGLNPTQIIKITTSPNTHYGLASLSVTGATQIDGGDTYYITGNCTITVSFDLKWNVKGGNSESANGTDAFGDWGTYNKLTYTGTANTYEGTITLAANEAYWFKVVERTGTGSGTSDSYYGFGTNGTNEDQIVLVGQGGSYNLYTGDQHNVVLMSAGSGSYKFTWNSSTKVLQVTYPSVEHPSTDYVYCKKASDWSPVNAHLWGGDFGTVWGHGPSLNSCNFDGTTYYYTAIGDANKLIFGQGPSNEHKTQDLDGSTRGAPTSNNGKFYDASDATFANWNWATFTATLTLDHQGPTNSPAPSSVTVSPNASTNINADIITTTPVKGGYYTFGGYYTEQGGGGTQIIGTDEKIPSNLAGYTSSGNWIKKGSSVSARLYAKWTQTVTLDDNGAYDGDGSLTATYNAAGPFSITTAPRREGYVVEGYYADAECTHKVMTNAGALVDYTGYVSGGKWVHDAATRLYTKWAEDNITVTVNAGDHGEVSTTSVTGHPETVSSSFTVTADDGYAFSHWTFSEAGKADTNYVSTGGTNNATQTFTLTTKKAITITANYVVRYGLYGSLDDGPTNTRAGMPGWAVSQDFTYSAGDYSTSVTLTRPNTNYKFRVLDRRDNTSWGLASKVVIPASETTTLGSTANDALLATAGTGSYTLAVVEADEGAHPSVTITNAPSHQVTYGHNTGGSVTSVVDGEGFDIESGQYVKAGGSVTYTAAAETGYEFVGWCTDDSYGDPFTTDNPWTDEGISAASIAYAKFVPVELTFEGDVTGHETEWNLAGNWSPACVPTIEHDVVLSKPVTVNVANAKAKSVLIDQNSGNTGKLTVDAGKALVVATTIQKKNAGGSTVATEETDIVLESDGSNGTGALVAGSASADTKATVHFYSKAKYDAGRGYINQYFGIPMDSVSKLNYYGSYLRKYDQSNDSWESFSESKLGPWTAYRIMREETSEGTYQIGGKLLLPGTSGTQELILYNNASHTHDNMFANSWTAPIDIRKMVSAFTGAVATIYIFNAGSASDYSETPKQKGASAGNWNSLPAAAVMAVPGDYDLNVIPAQQAFLVQANGSEGTHKLTLDYKTMVYDPLKNGESSIIPTRAPQRAEASDLEIVRMFLAGESGLGDRVLMYVRNDFSADELDNGWEAYKLPGSAFAPQLCAYSGLGEMSISATNVVEGTVLGFYAGTEDSEYTFTFDYEGEQVWYLNDLEAQQSTLIDAETSYDFTAVPGTVAEHRFVISHTPIAHVPTGIDNSDAVEGVKARKQMINGILYIIRGGQIYSTDGQIVK